MEAWLEKRTALGAQANGFLLQPEADAEAWILALSERLVLACEKDQHLFQVTALLGLRKLSATQEELRRDLESTRSQLLAEIERLREAVTAAPFANLRHAARALQDPVRVDITSLVQFHSMILADEVTSALTGHLRTHEVWLGGETPAVARFVPPPAATVFPLLLSFTRDWDQNASEFERDPFGAAARFHHRLVSIHPFEDGNGRLARILTQEQLRVHARFQGHLSLRGDPLYISALVAADNGDIRPLGKLLFLRGGNR